MGLLTMGGVVEVASMIDSTFVRCDILDRHWPLPPRPADCEFDYSQGISLSAGGPAKFVCAGDTVFGPDDVLPCDEWVTRGSLRCDSAVDGITCHDLSTGHGFFVSRQSYRLF
ncbi:MAG: DUF6636 domain-containing protein [Mycobacterium sp.]